MLHCSADVYRHMAEPSEQPLPQPYQTARSVFNFVCFASGRRTYARKRHQNSGKTTRLLRITASEILVRDATVRLRFPTPIPTHPRQKHFCCRFVDRDSQCRCHTSFPERQYYRYPYLSYLPSELGSRGETSFSWPRRMKPRNPAKAAEKKGVALVSEDVIPIKPAIEPARQQNFGKQFMATKGPPQIFLVALLSSISYGVIYGILPKVMMQRFAELKHGYSGPDCESFGSDEIKPDACRLGSIDAQNAHSISEFVAQLFIVATGPVVGGLSDIHGRKTLFALATLASLLGNFGFFYVYMRAQASPWVFYVLRGCHGMVSWQVTALASAADAVPPEFRAPGRFWKSSAVERLPSYSTLIFSIHSSCWTCNGGFLGWSMHWSCLCHDAGTGLFRLFLARAGDCFVDSGCFLCS